MFSLFLPACTLGPAAPSSARSHKFHIEERKDGTGTTKAGGGGFSLLRIAGKGGATGGGGHGSRRAWSFRARSREEMMEWWNDLRMLCARFLVASEQSERSGPVAAAVRSAGYVTESEEEEEEEEEEQSSADEEERRIEEVYEDASAELPGYAQHAMNGYPVGFIIISYRTRITNTVMQVEKGDVKINGDGNGIGPGPNVDDTPAEPLSRRPSRRQQEKAPEGQAPHVWPYTEGPDNEHHEEERGHGQDQNGPAAPTAGSGEG